MAICSVMVRMVWQDIPCANVLWFDVTNTSPAGLSAVVEQVGDIYVSGLVPVVSDNLEHVDTLVRVFDGGAPFTQVIQPSAFPVVGGQDAQDLPRNCAILLSTSHGGPRPNRGKVYVAGMTEANWDGDGWTSGVVAGVSAFAASMVDLTGATWVIARPNYAANTAIGHQVNDYVVRTRPGSQRGRITG
jgi:hypothetical protein